MSSSVVRENVFCGFLGLETKENTGVFEKKFCQLDRNNSKLQYYSEKAEVSDNVFFGSVFMHIIFCCIFCEVPPILQAVAQVC